MAFFIGFISFFAPTTEKQRTGDSEGGGTPRAPGSPRGTFWLWLGCRVRFGPKSCPGPGNTYIYTTCPTRVVSKNDSGLGKTEVYGKRKNYTQTLRSKGLSKFAPWLGKTRVHDKTPRETFVPNRNVRHDVRQKTSVARIWRRFWASRVWRATTLNKQAFDKRKFTSQVVSTRVFFVHPVVSRQFGRKCRQQIAFSRSKFWSKRRVHRKPVDKNTERKDTRGPAGCAEHLNKLTSVKKCLRGPTAVETEVWG